MEMGVGGGSEKSWEGLDQSSNFTGVSTERQRGRNTTRRSHGSDGRQPKRGPGTRVETVSVWYLCMV